MNAGEPPPGFAKSSTSPAATGSLPMEKTMGTSVVASFAAVMTELAMAYIRLTFSCSKILAASAAKLLDLPSYLGSSK